jgi:predicted transcriptional regulator
MADEPLSASLDRELTSMIVAAYVRQNQIASDQLGTLISTVRQALVGLGKPAIETEMDRTPRRPDPAIRSSRLCRLPRLWLARSDAETAYRERA